MFKKYRLLLTFSGILLILYGLSYAGSPIGYYFSPERVRAFHDLTALDSPINGDPAEPDSIPVIPLPTNTAPKQSSELPPFMHDRQGSPYSGHNSRFRQRSSPLLPGMPSNVNFKVELDSSGKFYTIYEKIGYSDYRATSTISVEDYQRMKFEMDQRRYQDSIADGGAAPRDPADTTRKGNSLIPPIYLGPIADRLFGGSYVDLQPNGSILLDFGGKWQRIANPQIPVRNQRNGGFAFDQQIQLNLAGKIGEKLAINVNYDTKNTFQFENNFKIGYNASEEDIVQELTMGNVNMPVSNSLITGAQNLMGIKTRLRFGKLHLSAVASQQRGTTEQLVIRGGAQAREFEIRADQYEGNKHFFLSHFFRENYERSLRTIPVITAGVVITRVEVYVTNRNNNTQTLRNLAALMDLGEGNPYRKTSPAVGPGLGGPSRNAANELFASFTGNALARDVDQVSGVLEGFELRKGGDFEILRAARKLDMKEYTFHPNLGYVSLVTPLRNDEVLAVSYEYTYNGQTYKVGEMTEDYQSREPNDVILLKLLKPSTIRTDLPVWNLMMKNIYSLQTNQIEKRNFQFRIIYRDDLTGLDNPSIHEGTNTKDVPLVQVMNLDKLNQNNDPQPDGNFDFVDGITIDARNGRVIFPVLEPFGSHLERQFFPETELQLINKYVFNELYRNTQADAQLLTNKSKFFLRGSYQSATSNEIALPGINISPGSVQITAGSTMLSEGTDYVVDYQLGRVKIQNEGVLSSGKEIRIQYERADLFNFQTRNLLGIDAQYHLSKDIRFTATAMHLNERPVITRVSIGGEPTRNTLWGFGVNYRKDSRMITRLIDKMPLISTKEKSTVVFSSEFAQLIPGANQLVKKDGGTSYIDDFEGAEIPYDLTRQPTTWALGSTPEQFLPAQRNSLEYGYRRARLAWYTVDNTAFYQQIGGGARLPANITAKDKANHYVRLIPFNEIFKNRDAQLINQPEFALNLAYYPNERAPYNFNPDLNADGTLKNPRNNFGAITKAITYDIDFDNINVQYIEFWMLDPFIGGENGKIISRKPNGELYNNNNTTGGELYFNLGNISEDYIPDSRHGFENGLPKNNPEIGAPETKTTVWGRVTENQYLTNAFDAEGGARTNQDVGMDGINDETERQHYNDYLQKIQGQVSGEALSRIQADPAGDNFAYYLSEEADAQDLKVFDRYKFFNGMERNSPEGDGTASSSFLPDNEDLNRDNTLNDLDSYYEYKVDLKPGQLDTHPYVVDKVTSTIGTERVTWYQFRIPIRESFRKVGGIEGFKSIRFMRTYLTGWEQPVVLRMVQFQLVGTQWRPFVGNLQQPGLNLPPEPYNPSFKISSINIEENGQPATGIINYSLPPGFVRDINLTSNTNARLNEQSLKLCVDKMQDRDSRAAYKNLIVDMVNYKRVQLHLHAESEDSNDGEVVAFLRLGTDFKENYYEIEVPLKMTKKMPGVYNYSSEEAWLNEVDIAVDDLINLKFERNQQKLSLRVPYIGQIGEYRVTVIGNPDISSVQTVMIGVRNPESNDGLPRSVCIWANELRVSGFDRTPGWAAASRLNLQLADLANVNASMRYITPYFGGIQDKISQRSRVHNLEYDISSNIRLDKFLLHKAGISLPMFVSLERRLITPYFNPLDPDMKLKKALLAKDEDERKAFRELVQDETVRRSINFNNVRKTKVKQDAKSHLWDVENLSLSYAYNHVRTTNIRTAVYEQRNTLVGVAYTYANMGQPFEPFRSVYWLDAPYLKFLKEFNISPLPNNITVRGDVERRFTKTQLRSADLTTQGIAPLFEKAFTFTRNYNVNWALSKNLRVDYTAIAYAIIDEPTGEINGELANPRGGSTRTRRDSVMYNLMRLGRMKNYNQRVGVNYKLPFDKFPVTNWVDAEVRYEGGYTWTAGAIGIRDTLGDNLQNNNQVGLNGQINLKALYDKNPFLRSINNPQTNQEPVVKGEERKRRLQARLQRLGVRRERVTEDFKSIEIDAQGDSTAIPPKEKEKFDRRIKKIGEKEEKIQKKLRDVEAMQERERNKNKPANAGKGTKAVLRTLMSVQKVNFTYSETNATQLPGVIGVTPSFVGLSSDLRPGVGFVMGSQDIGITERAAREGWLSNNPNINNAFAQARTKQLGIRTNIDPVKDFSIQLEAKRTSSGNYSELLRVSQGVLDPQSAVRNGSYSISFMSIKTAFSGDDGLGNSGLFNDFIANRQAMKSRLDQLNREGTYDINAQDVLIPSFIAAYSGKNIGSQKNTAFPAIPMPNWRVTYSGLSNLEFFKKKFRSVQLQHGYASEYSIGSYTSSLLFDAEFLRLNVSEQDIPLALKDPSTGMLTPALVVNQVVISEAFNPLVGVAIRTNSNMTINVRFNKQRNIGLNLSNAQVTELKNNDLTIDVGYTKAKFKIPFKINGSQKILKNDLTFRMALTLRDTRTIQRQIEDNLQESTVTAGNFNLQFRPTLAYVVNQRVNLQFYFDRAINQPRISNSFRRTNTAFGVQLRFNLAGQ